MSRDELLREYARGPAQLRAALADWEPAHLTARPIPGRWSALEVVCHLADFETVYADRLKRVLAETSPRLLSGDPDLFAARLAYSERDLEEELTLIAATRRQVERILRHVSEDDFRRTGEHSTDGPLTLETLLRRVTGHIPHHLPFLEEKRRALRGQ